MRLLIASSSPPDRGSGINAAVNELCGALLQLGCELHYLSPAPTDRSWLDERGIAHLALDQHTSPATAAAEPHIGARQASPARAAPVQKKVR